MLIFNNEGKVVGEMNNVFTEDGGHVLTNTLYDQNGNPAMQHVSIRDNQGNVHSTNVIGGKIRP